MRAFFAKPDSIGAHGPRITRLRRSGCTTASFVGFVDHTVAIFVETIAFWRYGHSRRTRLRNTIHASAHRRLTDAKTAGYLPETIVDLPIAIIVFSVANFGAIGQDFTNALIAPLTIDARERPAFALADAHGGRIAGVTGHRITGLTRRASGAALSARSPGATGTCHAHSTVTSGAKRGR